MPELMLVIPSHPVVSALLLFPLFLLVPWYRNSNHNCYYAGFSLYQHDGSKASNVTSEGSSGGPVWVWVFMFIFYATAVSRCLQRCLCRKLVRSLPLLRLAPTRPASWPSRFAVQQTLMALPPRSVRSSPTTARLLPCLSAFPPASAHSGLVACSAGLGWDRVNRLEKGSSKKRCVLIHHARQSSLMPQ